MRPYHAIAPDMEEIAHQSRVTGRGFSVGRVHFDEAATFARHAHRSAHLVLLYAGKWVDRAHDSIELAGGEVLFLPANTFHENRTEAGSDLVIADFDADFVSAFQALHRGAPRALRYSFQAFDDIPERLREEVLRNDAPSVLMADALLRLLMAVGARILANETGRPDWLGRVMTHIHLHTQQPLTVAELAAVGMVSSSRLAQGFRRHVGRSVAEYVRAYRLRVAARALRQTTRSIKDIALNYGFYDHAHFSRAFTRLHGMAPIEYRRRMRMTRGAARG
jgi:AraC-like DNA-binding protein